MSNPLDFWRGGLLTRDRELGRFVERFFDDLSAPGWARESLERAAFNPSCEVKETPQNYLVRFDLPGVPKEQIKIDLHDGYLTVSGERKEEKKEEKDKSHFSEVRYGSFSRSFSFPTQVDAEKVEAKFDHGVLSISIPKKSATPARQISIR